MTHDLGDLCSSPAQEALGICPKTSLELWYTAVVTLSGQLTTVNVQDFLHSHQFCHQGRRASSQGYGVLRLVEDLIQDPDL